MTAPTPLNRTLRPGPVAAGNVSGSHRPIFTNPECPYPRGCWGYDIKLPTRLAVMELTSSYMFATTPALSLNAIIISEIVLDQIVHSYRWVHLGVIQSIDLFITLPDTTEV